MGVEERFQDKGINEEESYNKKEKENG